ncbi:MAG: cysteine desulfurase NifS [delta proteobacterium ML8_F1]|nr:MAG: cysteine desulfurase NifS [delta proteobacterium ML8_F1]
MKKVYLDYSATTPVKPAVVEAMLPYFSEYYGNASSIYEVGRASKSALEKAREQIAQLIGARPSEIFFTAGGTEADNWALKSVAYDLKAKGRGNHLITTKIEHHAILHTCEYLEKNGFEVTYLDVDAQGMIDLKTLEEAITPQTILISIMYINNEIGTMQPIRAIGTIAREKGVLFHTDAVQALGNVPIDVNEDRIDLLSLSAHKIYGPKGVGALYVRQGTRITPFIHGGAQENKRRAGTENIAGIVGFGEAARLAGENLEEHIEKLTALRERLKDGLLAAIPEVVYNGHPTMRHPGNINLCFKYVEGEAMILMLDHLGVAASSGSACTSGSLDPSHVLMAIGLSHEYTNGSLRLSVGDFTTEADVDYVIEKLPAVIQRLREMSPLYEAAEGGRQ